MGAVYLVRHGQASFGADDYDRLSEVGAEQSAAVGKELRRRGLEFTGVYCGTMTRQRDTALAAGFEPVQDARWNEYDFLDVLRGHGSGNPDRGDPRRFQAALDEALLAWVAAAEGSDCGESWPAFAGRIGTALEDTVTALGRGENALVFTSGGVIGAIAALLIGDQAGRFTPLHRVTCNAGITKLVAGRSGLTLVAFNEHGHFEGEGRHLLTYR
ncbi:histidine phosphatase family protein [Prauserella muralis]|uniref:Histidine phosphatase family protein n=1 Tax=Prauserella muralis TaxID=588067 RepID=A0A2V4APN8_9PSEU|nr:histidine phosphatase family protein [Prauserella muralis]PXY22673.1 histidine phosphatase family protein [Prauserella muralis]TWE28385.1 broad specificity phosphatase PhoE [Prauserella muralis]